ncbi:MAG: tail fiber domain-containing protein [Bacteroidota bacterium]
MRKICTWVAFLCAMIFFSNVYAQSTKGINYQSVVRDNTGALIPNQSVNLRFQIIKGSAAGTIVYDEDQASMTNDFSLFSVVIGEGTPTIGSFSNINWGDDDYFLKVFFNGTDMGTTELESVPYSKVATEMDLSQLQDVDAVAASVGDVLKWNGSKWTSGSDNEGTSPWGLNGSNVSYNDGNVGIGTSTPAFPLHVIGRAKASILESRFIKSPGDIEFTMDESDNPGLLAFFEVFNGAGNHTFWVNEVGNARVFQNLFVNDKIAVGDDPGTPATTLHVNHPVRSTATNNQGLFLENTGTNGNSWSIYTQNSNSDLSLYVNGTTLRGNFSDTDGAYSTVSDIRLKTDVEDMNPVLSDLMQLQAKRYHYIGNEDKKFSLGFMAQEVEQFFPELVSRGGDAHDLYTLNYSGMSVLAITAIQEQQETIEEQKELIQSLLNRVGQLERKIEDLK